MHFLHPTSFVSSSSSFCCSTRSGTCVLYRRPRRNWWRLLCWNNDVLNDFILKAIRIISIFFTCTQIDK
jgi:hypothetical protein